MEVHSRREVELCSSKGGEGESFNTLLDNLYEDRCIATSRCQCHQRCRHIICRVITHARSINISNVVNFSFKSLPLTSVMISFDFEGKRNDGRS